MSVLVCYTYVSVTLQLRIIMKSDFEFIVFCTEMCLEQPRQQYVSTGIYIT